MGLPGTNAKLRDIRAASARKPNGDPGGPGPVVWQGNVPGYLTRKDEETMQGDREVIQHITQFHAFLSEGAPETATPGGDWAANTILVEDLEGNQTRYTVTAFDRKGQGTPADKIQLTVSNPVAA